VPNVASDIAVRTMGIPQLAPADRDLWGIDSVEGPLPSAYVYYDLLADPIPDGNWAPTDDNGTHGEQRWLDATREQLNAFWQPDGMIQNFCDGPCNPE